MLVTKSEIKVDQDQTLVGDAHVHYGCNELVAIHIEIKDENLKIKNIRSEKYIVLSLLGNQSKEVTITLIDYPGYKIWACNIYKSSLRLCIFKKD